MNRIRLGWRALRELGLQQVMNFGVYRLGLISGSIRRQTLHPPAAYPGALQPLGWKLPGVPSLFPEELLQEAGEILSGQVCLFGGPPVALQLAPPGPLRHWTEHVSSAEDIKFTWEPARFGWACTLARAYAVNSDERYAAAFWQRFEEFQRANPPYLGPNWASAQEAALRLIHWAYCLEVLRRSPASTPQRLEMMAAAVAAHAARIPPTLSYAKAQNNNHLLSEAAGLYTAARLLPQHPQANQWRSLGWSLFQRGLQDQIAADGVYMQHSTNYHRLMLQLALWVFSLWDTGGRGETVPPVSIDRLRASLRWLLALLDPLSGQVPNLGPNDGAYILPLTSLPSSDYRPVLQAASRMFCRQPALPEGPWDEMAAWYPDCTLREAQPLSLYPPSPIPTSPLILYHPTHPSWAYLRAARFHDRPGHTDQLHVDLWWRGLNLAQDAGTYRYQAPPPWDNALSASRVHNTLTVNRLDQMTRAGRFLFLDWAQASLVSASDGRIIAEHDGYRRLGLLHRRSLEVTESGWRVEDVLGANGRKPAEIESIEAAVYWLLPDWPWRLDGSRLNLASPYGAVTLEVSGPPGLETQLVRAGELLSGAGPADSILGWVAPTYNIKVPALSLNVFVRKAPPITLTSEWLFPNDAS